MRSRIDASFSCAGEPAYVPAMRSDGMRRTSDSPARSATPGAAPSRKTGPLTSRRTAGTSKRPGTRPGNGSRRTRDATSTPVPSATTSSDARARSASSASRRVSITNSGFAVITNVRCPAAWRSMIRSAAAARSTRSKPTPRMSTRRGAKARSLVDCDEAYAEEVEVFEREARALGDAIERVFGHVAGDAGNLREELVHVAQERAAAGEDHPFIDDVGRELRRSLLEDGLHGTHDLLKDRIHRLGDLIRADRDRARQAGDEVAPAHLHRELRIHRQRRPDLDLHVLGRAFPDHEVVALEHKVRDRFVELVARGANAARHHDAAE